MKYIFAIATLTFSISNAHALKVGDNSVYAGTTNGQAFTLFMTVSQINGDAYTASSTVSLGGQTETGDSTGSVNDIAQGNLVFGSCLAYGGTLESVATPARAFTACHLTVQGDELYVSPEVPFGFVKSITTREGSRIEMLLQSFLMQ